MKPIKRQITDIEKRAVELQFGEIPNWVVTSDDLLAYRETQYAEAKKRADSVVENFKQTFVPCTEEALVQLEFTLSLLQIGNQHLQQSFRNKWLSSLRQATQEAAYAEFPVGTAVIIMSQPNQVWYVIPMVGYNTSLEDSIAIADTPNKEIESFDDYILVSSEALLKV